MKSVFVCFAVLACQASLAYGQTCLGSAPASRARPGWTSLHTSLRTDVSAFGGDVGGAGDSFFGGGGVQANTYDDPQGTTWQINGILGYQIAATPSRTFVFCPMSMISYENASPLFVEGVQARAVETTGGLSVGVIAYGTETLQVVPTGGFFLGSSTATVSAGSSSTSEKYNFVLAQFGVGFVYGRASLTPMVAKTFGDFHSTTFILRYGYSFGGK